MDALRSYLTTAMLASVASAICIQFTDDRFRKYVKYLAGLCLLLVLTLPLMSLLSDIDDFELSLEESREVTLSGDSEYINLLGSSIADSVGDRVSLLYDLPREAVYVTLTLNTADLAAIEIESIEVVVNAECDETSIEQALANEFACTVHVREELARETTD